MVIKYFKFSLYKYGVLLFNKGEKQMSKPKVNIYTDGSLNTKTKKGGYCGLLECEHHKCMIFNSRENTTNNVMELEAVVEALKKLNTNCDVTIYADSRYVIDPIGKKYITRWEKDDWRLKSKDPVKNLELWKEVKEQLKKHDIKVQHVKAHSGHFLNELCNDVAQLESGVK